MTSLIKRLFSQHVNEPDVSDGPASPSVDKAGAERLARQLESIPGYRVLRELSPDAGVETLPPRTSMERMAAVVDTETTGLDPDADLIIEVAIQRFIFDPAGSIIVIERPRSWLEDPRRPLSGKISRLTGIGDEELSGTRFDDEAITSMIGDADVILAHNAAFDRPFLESRFPQLRNLSWGCTLSQLDWQSLGYDGRALGHLLFQSGRFFKGHRAANDTNALTTLLGTPAHDGRTILAHLLECCERDSVRIDAVGAPFEARAVLKGNGYRWDATRRVWWREIEQEDLVVEKSWLERDVYRGKGNTRSRVITPKTRFQRDS